MQKNVVAIQDICCAGKCSLTIALPVLSAAGISCSVLPTAVFSTHTGGFSDVYSHDLTADIAPIVQHWLREEIWFDALYSGYLFSADQIETVKAVIEMFRSEALRTGKTMPRVLVDPAMGDGGKLYRLCTPDMVTKMAELCGLADLIVPNVTEAAFLLGEPQLELPHTRTYIDKLMQGLTNRFTGDIVLTGVSLSAGEIGCICRNRRDESAVYLTEDREEGAYHGTGDLFSSALLAGLLHNQPLQEAVTSAMCLVSRTIRQTVQQGAAERDGLLFESCMEDFIKSVSQTL